MPVGVWDMIFSAPLIDFGHIYLPYTRVEGLEVGEGVGAPELWFRCIARIRDSRDPGLERYDVDVVNILICSLFFCSVSLRLDRVSSSDTLLTIR